MIAVRIVPAPFDAGVEIDRLATQGVGAVASFVGIVRGDDGLVSLTLEHYPGMAETVLQTMAEAAAARWCLRGVTVHHRVGTLLPGDKIVLVACAASHRRDAFDACAFLMDRLKVDGPFWKRERFADGRDAWVEPRQSDDVAAARWVS